MTTFYIIFEPEHDVLSKSGTWLAHHLGYIEVSAPDHLGVTAWANKTYGLNGYRMVTTTVHPDMYPLKKLRCVIL